jgi:group I intron endonuclease
MVDYSKGVVYKIFCNDKNILDFYIGSTNNFKMRKKYHITNSKKKNCKLYQTIRENGGWKNWTMELIEEYPCTCRDELVIRERYWYDELKPTLNINRPYRSDEEEKVYRKKNVREYWETNKEAIKQQIREYKEANKEAIKQKRREYYKANKESLKQKSREYREANKESINQKRRKNKNIE